MIDISKAIINFRQYWNSSEAGLIIPPVPASTWGNVIGLSFFCGWDRGALRHQQYTLCQLHLDVGSSEKSIKKKKIYKCG